jgi:hypothetical protein
MGFWYYHYYDINGTLNWFIEYMKSKIRIGCGAGFSGDRFEPSLILAQKGQLDYLVLECLAERTIALAQKNKQADPSKGYDPHLERRMIELIPHVYKNKIRLISNMGAANPIAAARKIAEIAKGLGVSLKIAAITGDDVLDYVVSNKDALFDLENGASLNQYDIISANAYLGADKIVEAIGLGADIIITGRVADPSLFLAPMIFEFGWSMSDFDKLGQGTVLGHLLECAGQVSGGYFADGLQKKVEGLERLGHPFVDVFENGDGIIGKVEGTGGIINRSTCKEQLLYEVINPFEYITPDVCANFTNVEFTEVGPDRVLVTGGKGTRTKDTLGTKLFFLAKLKLAMPAMVLMKELRWQRRLWKNVLRKSYLI